MQNMAHNFFQRLKQTSNRSFLKLFSYKVGPPETIYIRS